MFTCLHVYMFTCLHLHVYMFTCKLFVKSYIYPTEQLAGGGGVAPEEHTQGHLPVSSSDYENYTYVIPSARTIADYKQIQASEMETMAARALYMKKPNIKAFVHFCYNKSQFDRW